MASPQVFLSFDLAHDEANRVEFVSQIGNCPTAFSAPLWSAKVQADAADSEKVIRGKIGSCDLLIVLVGLETATAANVEKEIGMAKQRNVPFFGIYVGGADQSAGVPAGLPANRTIPCDWRQIDSAINQLMREGKHHVFR